MDKPVMLETPDFSALKNLAQDYIDAIENDEYIDDDYPHYIFECVIETFFGKKVWDFVNERDE